MKSRQNTVLFALVLGGAVGAAIVLRLRGIPYITQEKQWSIGIYTGASPLDLHAASGVSNPVLSARDVTDVPAKFVADPFLIQRDATWYMFFEVLNADNGRGEIGFASSDDTRHWRYGRIVLAEPFHLSYPYVFAADGIYYMIPESGAAQSVRLYKSDDFPTHWVFVDTLLSGSAFADSSLVRFGNTWFLFTETRPYVNDTLGLYVADALTGPWRAHPQSPIVGNNPHSSRPAGRIVATNGTLLRFAQDDSPNYGTQVFGFEITTLTATTYAERPVGAAPILRPGDDGWNAKGMHQIDAHQVGEHEWIACVDGAQRHWTVRVYPR